MSGNRIKQLPFCTIQAAVSAATPGTDIRVRKASSPYDEQVTAIVSGTADSPITIEADDPANQPEMPHQRPGLKAIKDYLREERGEDSDFFPHSPALFLPAFTIVNSKGTRFPYLRSYYIATRQDDKSPSPRRVTPHNRNVH